MLQNRKNLQYMLNFGFSFYFKNFYLELFFQFSLMNDQTVFFSYQCNYKTIKHQFKLIFLVLTTQCKHT